MRILGEEFSHEPILVRDLKDTHYPDSSQYKDFDRKPSWHFLISLSISSKRMGRSLHLASTFASTSIGVSRRRD
jgi:hypothetical protein